MSVSWFNLVFSGSEFHRPRAVGGDLVEAQPALGVTCIAAGKGLPATDRGVDKPRLDFQRTGLASDPLGGKDRGARAGEAVEDYIPPACTILDGVGHQGDRLGGWMRAKLLHAAS